MYVTLRHAPGEQVDDPAARRGARGVSRVVVLLGLTSLLTDVSSEMVAAVLPLYLTVSLGLSPLQYGFVDGLYNGVTVLVRLVGGFTADRSRRPKLVATIGYGISAVSKFALLPVSSLAAVSAVVATDRVGKGLRTAPRDALIAGASRPEMLATAFGVHRALDTVGAMCGPLLAFGLLAVVVDGFDVVIAVSGCIAMVGVALLALLVPDHRPPRAPTGHEPSLRRVLAVSGGRQMRPLLAAVALLGVVTVSDGFLYLVIQERHDLAVAFFPLLFVGTSAVYLTLAVPMGRLADRLGRGKVLVGGHVALLLAYVAALGTLPGLAGVVVCLVMLGTYYAATDGVLAAAGAALLPTQVRGSGLAVVQTVTAGSRLVSSLLFGALWAAYGRNAALAVFAVALALALPPAARLLGSLNHPRPATGQPR